jgi:hypothetical protein
MIVETLKEAIVRLPEEEWHSLAAWINEPDYDDWDKEMAKDFTPGGRGAHLIERVKRPGGADFSLQRRLQPASCRFSDIG